jgi:hypothetical protein
VPHRAQAGDEMDTVSVSTQIVVYVGSGHIEDIRPNRQHACQRPSDRPRRVHMCSGRVHADSQRCQQRSLTGAGAAQPTGGPVIQADWRMNPHTQRLLCLCLATAQLRGARGAPATLVERPIASGAAPVYLDGADWTLEHLANATAAAQRSGNRAPQINATVPGDILSDLQRAGRIPDPYWNTSWREPSFISAWNEGSWRYSKRFDWTPPPAAAAQEQEQVLLCFDGVLMGAVLELNGQLLTSTTNPLLGNVSGVRKRKTRLKRPFCGVVAIFLK